MRCESLLFVLYIAAVSCSYSGEELHCIGNRAHILKYNMVGNVNGGAPEEVIENAAVSIEPASEHAAKCSVKGTPAGDKSFCYGVNDDSTCTSAKEVIPLDSGEVDCNDCFVGASADLFYKLNYTWHALNSVEVGVRDMHLRSDVSLHKHLSGSKIVAKGTKVLSTNATRKTLIDKVVGKCPLCVKVKIEVSVPTSLDYELDFKGQSDVTVGAALDVDLGERSIKWDRFAGWSHPKPETKLNIKPILDVGSEQSEGDLKFDLDTALQLHVDDIISYRENLKSSFPLKCTEKGSVWPARKAQFCLDGEASFTLGHEADLHWNLLKFKENHHWGPYQDFSWSKPDFHDCKNVGSNMASASNLVV